MKNIYIIKLIRNANHCITVSVSSCAFAKKEAAVRYAEQLIRDLGTTDYQYFIDSINFF